MAISKEIQKSSEMKFNGKLIQVTYDIADVNGKDAWREVVHHPGATAIVAVTEDNKIVMERQFRYALQQTLTGGTSRKIRIQMKNRLFVLNGSLLRKPAIVQLNGFR
mgnify:CR=1 FL=1